VARAQEAAAAREASALATAQSESRRREQAEAERAASDRRRLDAEAAAERAIRERQAAEAALSAAERARVEAERAQQRLAEERAAADRQSRSQASAEEARQASRGPRPKADLRERLQRQLNIILETRETARGLIVNVSDVLFDTGQHTLTSGARERLATVAGILLAYPGLSLEVDGHTDSVGDDDYNQALSERRAESVRGYLIQRGIPTTAIAALGYGESQPVASNDIRRRQNRRVELVVSGESIGRPRNGRAQATMIRARPWHRAGGPGHSRCSGLQPSTGRTAMLAHP
jgi:outer membrane protein OmpA-like peptidoglycan-associated protein